MRKKPHYFLTMTFAHHADSVVELADVVKGAGFREGDAEPSRLDKRRAGQLVVRELRLGG